MSHSLRNHVILTVPLLSDTIFLECTAKNSPAGYLGTFTQGRKALLIDKKNSHLLSTPPLNKEDVLCTRNIEIDLTTSILTLNSTQKGNNYERSTYIAKELNKAKQEKYIQNNIINGSFDLLDCKIEESRDKPEIDIYAKCQMNNLHKNYGKNMLINPIQFEIQTYESPTNRKSNVQLDYPQYCKDVIIYQLGDQKSVKLPDDVQQSCKYGTYSITYSIQNNTIKQDKTLLIHKGKYSIDEYPEFYKFISTIKTLDSQNLIIELQ